MMRLDSQLFKKVIESTPLIAIDLLFKKGNQILLGKRVNNPAKGYFFSIGGRIMKNETVNQALDRIIKNELNIKFDCNPKFINFFEHFYDNSIFESVETHYVGLLFEARVDDFYSLKSLPSDQHDEYRWFSIDEILKDSQVHINVKDYFRERI
jgi:colanic acid biosynthesis protein WcaH